MIDPRAVAVQGIGYVAIVVATVGLLAAEQPVVAEGGGGSAKFYEPNQRIDKKKPQNIDGGAVVAGVLLKAKTHRPSAVGYTVIDVEHKIECLQSCSLVEVPVVSGVRNLSDEEFALLIAMV